MAGMFFSNTNRPQISKLRYMFSSYKQTTVSKWRRFFAITIADNFQKGKNPFQLQKQKSFQMADMFANSHVSKWWTSLPIHTFQNDGHVCQFTCFKMEDMFANSYVSKWRTCLPIPMFPNGGHVFHYKNKPQI